MTVLDDTILRVAAHFLLPNASDIVNVYHLYTDITSALDDADAVARVTSFVEDLMTNVQGLYSSDMELNEVECWQWNASLGRWDFVGSSSSAFAGNQGTVEWTPPAAAPLVTADTVDSHARGRKYLPPILEGSTSIGKLTSGALTALAGFLADYVSVYAIAEGDLIPGIFQVATETFKQFTGSGTVTDKIAYQRRRKDGVGD